MIKITVSRNFTKLLFFMFVLKLLKLFPSSENHLVFRGKGLFDKIIKKQRFV